MAGSHDNASSDPCRNRPADKKAGRKALLCCLVFLPSRNFYMSFMTCLFLVLWYLLYDHKKAKGLFCKRSEICRIFCESAMMAGAVLLPGIFGNQKISSAKWDFPKELWYGNFAEYLTAAISWVLRRSQTL